MIRAWRARHRAPQQLVDAAVVVTAQIDVRDGQIEGLRDALAEAQQRLALCQRELATYKTRDWLRIAVRARRRAAIEQRWMAEETTHHVPMRAPGYRASATEPIRRTPR